MARRYTHIMHNEKFIPAYIEFVNDNFNKDEHRFLVIEGKAEFNKYNILDKNIEYKSFKNIKNKVLKIIFLYKYLIKELGNSKKIYFHSLFDKKLILFLFVFRKYLKKSNWIIWGGDLYCYEKRKKGLKQKIWYYIEDYVKRNIAYISTLVPSDYEVAKKYYKINGKYQRAIYIFNKPNIKIINKIKSELYIQIGNSADPSNNHKEILDTLKKFRNEKIKIFSVLSYGSINYGKEVAEYGKNIFGEKFIPIFDFLSLDDYWKYISNIDILIFNHKRQQGLGNINMLCYLEKKIYLRNDISSWNYLTKDLKLSLNSFNNIKNESFEEFKLNNSIGNRKKVEDTVFSNEYMKKIWEESFKG